MLTVAGWLETVLILPSFILKTIVEISLGLRCLHFEISRI